MTKAEREQKAIEKLAEMKAHEDELRASGYRYVAGIDEVGRGPLAGPVYAACVILPPDFDVPGVNDSKKLSAKKREELSDIIKEKAVAWGIGIADNREIDDINILEATKNAMKRSIVAVKHMLAQRGLLSSRGEEHARDILLIDAVRLDAGMPSESIIKGDEKCLCIAAASIIAKVARDAYMTEMDAVYPGYDFASNKGYGTAAHYEGLRTLGKTPVHRMTFLKKFDENPENGHMQAGQGQAGHMKTACGQNGHMEAGQGIAEADPDPAAAGAFAAAAALASAGKKIYAVRKGNSTGIFSSWDECREQVEGFQGAEFKKFSDPEDALEYLGYSIAAAGSRAGVRVYVDGSYDEANGRYSCGAVIVITDAEGSSDTVELSSAFDDKEAARHRNIAGEIMGSRIAIEYCMENSIDSVEIYHDYAGIGAWADGRWKANIPIAKDYADFVAEARKSMDISFIKVKAHSGNKYNEIADKLAKYALVKYTP